MNGAKSSRYAKSGSSTAYVVGMYVFARQYWSRVMSLPAIWLNLSDFRNILIIHFGLLLRERTLDSIGHYLWIKI